MSLSHSRPECDPHSIDDLCSRGYRHVVALLGSCPRFDRITALASVVTASPEMLQWIIQADTEELRSRSEFYPRPVGCRLLPVAGE